MVHSPAEPRGEPHPQEGFRRATRRLVFGVTLLFVIAAVLVSSALVVYTAWLHDLRNGLFALLFAVLSTQIATNKVKGEAGFCDEQGDGIALNCA